jgi:PD-(D/E)XK nuclease superfamily protein
MTEPAFTRTHNPRKQGDSGMGIAIGWFACQGWTVCVPLTDSQPYDLVVDDGAHGLQRVSVRTSTLKLVSGSYEVGLRTRGGNHTQRTKNKHFDPKLVELLFVACEDGSKYLIPAQEINSRSSITVGRKHQQYRVGVV